MGEAGKKLKNGRNGFSRSALYNEIGNAHPGTSVAAVRRAIAKAVDDGMLVHGSSKARFKITDKAKESMKPKPKKKPAKKKNPAKKKKKTKKKKPAKKKASKKKAKKVSRKKAGGKKKKATKKKG